MFIYRAISFPILLGLLALMIFWPSGGPFLYFLAAVLAISTAVWELGTLIRKIGVKNYPLLSAVVTGLAMSICFTNLYIVRSISTYTNYAGWVAFFQLSSILVFVIGWGGLLFVKEKRTYLESMVGSIGSIVFLAVPLYMVAMIYFQSVAAFLFLILVTKSMDTGGYIFGKLSSFLPGGNHKIVPSISPKKSWEGTFGGILFSVVVALIFYYFRQRMPIFGLNGGILVYIFIGVVLALGSFAGDLTESAVKRCCDEKDSNHIIPGMGGVFDVLDSFIYNGILFVTFLYFLNKLS